MPFFQPALFSNTAVMAGISSNEDRIPLAMSALLIGLCMNKAKKESVENARRNLICTQVKAGVPGPMQLVILASQDLRLNT